MTNPAAILADSAVTPGPIVQTEAGLVRGRVRDGDAAFLGIPFAAPPVGDLRFAVPHPPAPWSGVREATAFGPTPQRRPFGELTTIPEPSIPGDDTLTVNVFTPAAGDESARLPVLVWAHGGGYFAGSPASPWYDGAAFTRDGVVVVTLAYRLGFDGFGWIEDAPLNRGILDQIAALGWVQRNIAAFGGDPDRVTIAGQSAGGGSVLNLLVSPRARGLFHRVISHSGAPGHVSAGIAEDVGRRFADALGVAPTAAALRELSEDAILDREREFNVAPGGITPDATPDAVLADIARAPLAAGLAFAPVIDDEVVLDVSAAVAAGVSADIPVLLGTTRNEFAFPAPTTRDEVLTALGCAGVDAAQVDAFGRDIDRVGEGFAFSQLLVLSMFRVPSTLIARRRGDAASVTWLYDFAYRSSVDGVSAHCYDLPFAWDLLAADGVARVLGTPPQELAERMHADWVCFISGHAPSWPSVAERASGAMTYDMPAGFDPDAYGVESAVLDTLE